MDYSAQIKQMVRIISGGCQQGDSGKEITSSISHRACWQVPNWDGCFCLLAGR